MAEIPEVKDSYLVDCSRLKQTKLWPGSMEEFDFNHGGLRVLEVRERIARLSRCDDKTPNEVVYLAILKDCLTYWPYAGLEK